MLWGAEPLGEHLPFLLCSFLAVWPFVASLLAVHGDASCPFSYREVDDLYHPPAHVTPTTTSETIPWLSGGLICTLSLSLDAPLPGVDRHPKRDRICHLGQYLDSRAFLPAKLTCVY